MDKIFNRFDTLRNLYPNYSLWTAQNPPKPGDVAQGYVVGNCYLMSALSVMANFPDLVQSVF